MKSTWAQRIYKAREKSGELFRAISRTSIDHQMPIKMFSQKLVSLPALFALVGALAGVASASLQDKREDSPYFWNDTTGPVVWDVKL